MPELPEVETIANDLRQANLVGNKIKKVRVLWPRTVACPGAEEFIRNLEGKTILNISRRAKYLQFTLDGGWFLFVHLRMTGRFLLSDPALPVSKHEHLLIDFDSGIELRFHDTRKFGRWYLINEPSLIEEKLGPEPLSQDFTKKKFKKMIQNKKGGLKSLLLNQQFVAGLGNIYVDEALWEAGLHPLKRACDLSDHEAAALHQAIRKVLERGIASQGTTLGTGSANYYRLQGEKGGHQNVMQVFRKTGSPCPRCGEPIARIVVAQRSTHFCPKCQSLPAAG